MRDGGPGIFSSSGSLGNAGALKGRLGTQLNRSSLLLLVCTVEEADWVWRKEGEDVPPILLGTFWALIKERLGMDGGRLGWLSRWPRMWFCEGNEGGAIID